MLLQLIFILYFVWLIYEHFKRKNIRELEKLIPKMDILALPFVGHAYKFGLNDESRMKAFQYFGEQAIKLGGVSALWLGRRFFINVADPEHFDLISRSCLQKDDLMKYIQDFTGNGLVFADVPIWRPRRKIMIPVFHTKILHQFIQIFSAQSKIMADKLENVCGKKDISLWHYVNTYAMDAVCETNLGISVASQSNPKHPFLTALETGSHCVASRICSPWLQLNSVYKLTPLYRLAVRSKKILYDFIEEIIQAKRKSLLSGEFDQYDPSKFKCFLEMLIKNSGGTNGYNNLELQEETLVILVAGTDTSADGACFTLKMLAKHPEIQEKVYQEIKHVFGDSKRNITIEDLPKLKYLEAVVKESLRLYPPVPIIVRKVEKAITLPSGITLIPGTGILLNIWALHRNPKFWGDDAEYFRPERFIETNLAHPVAFAPFSNGPRNCIGFQYAMLSMKTLVATVIMRYRVHLSSKTIISEGPERDPVKFDIMMKPTDNFNLNIERR